MRELIAASMRQLSRMFPGRRRSRVVALRDGGFYIYTGKPATLLDVLRDGTRTFPVFSASDEVTFDSAVEFPQAPETSEAASPEPWCYCI